MNMTEFTDKQLAVMAEESSPRGMSARKEIERRSKQRQSVAETSPVQEEVEQEKPKRTTTRRKRNTKQEESE
jgi:hypothetical protein